MSIQSFVTALRSGASPVNALALGGGKIETQVGNDFAFTIEGYKGVVQRGKMRWLADHEEVGVYRKRLAVYPKGKPPGVNRDWMATPL